MQHSPEGRGIDRRGAGGPVDERAGVDAGERAGVDAGERAGVDAGERVGVDAGERAGVDAGERAGVDAGEPVGGGRADAVCDQRGDDGAVWRGAAPARVGRRGCGTATAGWRRRRVPVGAGAAVQQLRGAGGADLVGDDV